MPNYELTSNKIMLNNGTVLTQIRALKDINCPHGVVRAGSLGGFLEGEHNLSQEDPCFVFYPAQILGKFRISGLNQLGGTVRLSPEGCHGFRIPSGRGLQTMLGDIPGQSAPVKEFPSKTTRFEILKKSNSLYDVHP